MYSLWLAHIGVALLDGHGGVLQGHKVEAALLRSLLAGNGGDLENKKGILSLICGVCNSSTVVVIPTKQGCEKGKTFEKKKFLLLTPQITVQGKFLRRGVKRERLFEKKEKKILFTPQITAQGKSFEKGCEKGKTF